MVVLNNYAESHGLRNKSIVVLRNLQKEVKENTLFLLKTKTHIQNAPLKRNFFDYHKYSFELGIEMI